MTLDVHCGCVIKYFLTDFPSSCQVFSALDSQSRGPGFEFRPDLYLNLFQGSPEFKS